MGFMGLGLKFESKIQKVPNVSFVKNSGSGHAPGVMLELKL